MGNHYKTRWIYFFAFYALFYSTNAVYGTFIPIYLKSIGYTDVLIGILLSIAPFIAIVAQPIWGLAGDRAEYKNTTLKYLLIGTGCAIVLYPLSNNFYYLIIVMSLFTFFQASIGPITDAITLEYLGNTGQKYGPIRMAGTLGYAIMSIIAGIILRNEVSRMFPLYLLILVSALFVFWKLPNIKGYQSDGQKMAVSKLFKMPRLMLYMSFNLIMQISLGFYYSFFGIYYKEIGGTNTLLGWSAFICAISEIPFLLFADRILKKLGTKYTLLISGVSATIRWFLLSFVTDPYWVLPIQLLHGLMFIVISYTLITYINENVPKELRASGQTLNGLVGMGVARIIGSLLGGILSENFGAREVFFINAIISGVAVLIYGSIFIAEDMRKRKISNPSC